MPQILRRIVKKFLKLKEFFFQITWIQIVLIQFYLN